MARIFITGSADGLGHLSADLLVSKGHQAVLHARNDERGREALKKIPGAENVVTGDLSKIDETIELASRINALGEFDAIIHNAGVYRGGGKEIFTVNTLAPYILTCLINMPKRLIYLSSGMHMHGHPNLENFHKNVDRISYSDTKLHVVMLAKAVTRKCPGVYANAVNPGWVPTKMGGAGAPDDLKKGSETQVWLSVSDDAEAKASGRYFFHQKENRHLAVADDIRLQDELLKQCEHITGVAFPTKTR